MALSPRAMLHAVGTREMKFAPLSNCRDDGHEALSSFRQSVFDLGRDEAVILARDHSGSANAFSSRLSTRGAISRVPAAPVSRPVLISL